MGPWIGVAPDQHRRLAPWHALPCEGLLARPRAPRATVAPQDTRSKSLSEALVNTFGGYPVGYAVGIAVLPATTGWMQEDPLVANAAVTAVFAAASFVRLYVLRRVFERLGYDDNVVRLAASAWRRLRARTRGAP